MLHLLVRQLLHLRIIPTGCSPRAAALSLSASRCILCVTGYHLRWTCTLPVHRDFAKVDIEGFEYKFLLGAQEALARFRPVLIMEWDDDLLRRAGSCAADMAAFLKKQNYSAYYILDSSDIIAVPPEKQHGLDLLDSDELKRI